LPYLSSGRSQTCWYCLLQTPGNYKATLAREEVRHTGKQYPENHSANAYEKHRSGEYRMQLLTEKNKSCHGKQKSGYQYSKVCVVHFSSRWKAPTGLINTGFTSDPSGITPAKFIVNRSPRVSSRVFPLRGLLQSVAQLLHAQADRPLSLCR